MAEKGGDPLEEKGKNKVAHFSRAKYPIFSLCQLLSKGEEIALIL